MYNINRKKLVIKQKKTVSNSNQGRLVFMRMRLYMADVNILTALLKCLFNYFVVMKSRLLVNRK